MDSSREKLVACLNQLRNKPAVLNFSSDGLNRVTLRGAIERVTDDSLTFLTDPKIGPVLEMVLELKELPLQVSCGSFDAAVMGMFGTPLEDMPAEERGTLSGLMMDKVLAAKFLRGSILVIGTIKGWDIDTDSTPR